MRLSSSGPLPVAAPSTSRQNKRGFLLSVYFGAVAIRLLIGWIIMYGGWIGFFAGDQWTYDFFGWGIAQSWSGELHNPRLLTMIYSRVGTNGMFYWVAFLYTILGHSQYLAVGAQILVVSFTPILAYKITHLIYGSDPAARYAALATGFLPSMVIWSCLLLKDPIIVLLIAVTVFYTLKLQKDLKFRYILPASIAILLVFPIRGYVFYFILLAVVGALLMSRFGKGASLTAYLIRLAGLAVIAIALFTFGFDKIAAEQINANLLEKVQNSRLDLAMAANSGFSKTANVSTLTGALSFMPTGILYLMFAPFPWQFGSVRASFAMPETLLWYVMFPYCLVGMLYTIRRHLRDALVVFLFVVQLTAFYGVFIGNVGTAHRQRTQIFIFYAIFTCVGWVYSRRKKAGLKGSISN